MTTKRVELTFVYEYDEENVESMDDESLVELSADMLHSWLNDGEVPEIGVNAQVIDLTVTFDDNEEVV